MRISVLWLMQTAQALGTRSLFLLGQLCRHAADFIDGAAEAGHSGLTLRRCMAIMLAYFRAANGAPHPVRPAHPSYLSMLGQVHNTTNLEASRMLSLRPADCSAADCEAGRAYQCGQAKDLSPSLRSCCSGGQRVQDGALQALGLLFAARPALMQSPDVAGLMRAVLQPSSPAAFKARLLTSLTDLLRARRCNGIPDSLSCLRFDPDRPMSEHPLPVDLAD